MGFGVLYIGYFLTICFEYNGVGIPPAFPGMLIMAYACKKLDDYSIFFGRTRKMLYITAGFSAAEFVLSLLSQGDKNGSLAQLLGAAEMVGICLQLLMHYFLLNALSQIANDVGRRKIAIKCKRNIYITALLLALRVALPFIPFDEGYSYIVRFIVRNLVIFINSVQIFSCYMWICYEGDEDMDEGSGIDPLSKLYSKSRKEYAEYKKEKANSKKNNKNNKNKR